MEEECAIALLKTETKTKQWGNFVCNVCESGCTKLLKEIIQFNASTPDRVCRDENEATPLMRYDLLNLIPNGQTSYLSGCSRLKHEIII